VKVEGGLDPQGLTAGKEFEDAPVGRLVATSRVLVGASAFGATTGRDIVVACARRPRFAVVRRTRVGLDSDLEAYAAMEAKLARAGDDLPKAVAGAGLDGVGLLRLRRACPIS
jgi:hypothetical protein